MLPGRAFGRPVLPAYQTLEALRCIGDQTVPGATQLENAIEGFQNQGTLGALITIAGPRTKEPSSRSRSAQLRQYDDALRYHDIDFGTYLQLVKQIQAQP